MSGASVCWTPGSSNLGFPDFPDSDSETIGCLLRFHSYERAAHECEKLRADFCGGVVKDNGMQCEGRDPAQTQYQLRTNKRMAPYDKYQSWELTEVVDEATGRQPERARTTKCHKAPRVTANVTFITEYLAGEHARQQLAPKPPCCAIHGFDTLMSAPTAIAPHHEHEVAMQQKALACHVAAKRQGTPGRFTPCMRELGAQPMTHALYSRPKAACSHLDYCSGRGDCFLGRCFCFGPFAGARCEQQRGPFPACSLQSDSCFRNAQHGRSRISLERWQRASWAEESWWNSKGSNAASTGDHAEEMVAAFRQFAKLPNELGHVIEVGCGPFTQLRTILGIQGRNWSVSSVTLADPILVHESKMANSAFSSGRFSDRSGKEYPTVLHQVGAESVGSLYQNEFDTTIMMNVLEHCISAFEVLESLYNVTKPGGIVVLWEPAYSAYWDWGSYAGQELLLDVSLPISENVAHPDWSSVTVRDTVRSRAFDRIAHPLRVDPSVFEFFASHFRPLYYRLGKGRRGDSSITLIGRKHRSPKPLPA